MHEWVSWTAAVFALVNAALALSMVQPIHRARAAAKAEKSILGGRIGLLIELGLLAYAVGALFRSGLAALAAILPIVGAVRRSERALGVVLGAFEPVLPNLRNLNLSVREMEVLAVIAAGKVSDQEIGDTLFISPSTAATHVRNILKKAELHDRRQLILIGLRDEPA
jgi:DNA-binding CsgD family transcriptional regulator